MCALSCLTLCDPMDCNPPGSSVHEIFQAGILEWVAIPFFWVCSWPRDWTRPPSPSPIPGVYPNSCPLSQWCHPTISSSVVPFSSCLQSFPASGSFPMSWLFTLCGQSIGASASASALSMNVQGWFPLGLTGLISLLSKRLSSLP